MSGYFTIHVPNSMGKMYCGKISKQRLEKGRTPHADVMCDRAYGTLPRNAPHGKDGEGKRNTRPVKKTRANVQYRRELG
jgi:hypothetical protein